MTFKNFNFKWYKSPFALQNYLKALEDGIERGEKEKEDKERAEMRPRIEETPPQDYPYAEVT